MKMGMQSRKRIDAMAERVRDVECRVGKFRIGIAFWPMAIALALLIEAAEQIRDVSERLRMLFDLESLECGDDV
jgi:hypothetical protein